MPPPTLSRVAAASNPAPSASPDGARAPARGHQFSGLWARPDFVRLWAAQGVSLFGSEITVIALPLTAVLVLGVSPSQMGFLAAAERLPFLLVGLLAGVLVDRLKYRSVLVAADLGRAVLLSSIPVAAIFGVLRIEQLYVVALLAGCLTVFFDIAWQSYLPALVERSELAEGNGKLEATRSVSEMAGPLLGSGLLTLVAAPFLMGIDALSFVVSAACLRSIRLDSTPNASPRKSILKDIRQGIRLVRTHPLLRPIAVCSATLNLFFQMLLAVFILYITQTLALPPAVVGVVFGIGSLGALLGALLAARAAKRFGTGPTIVGAAFVSALGALGISLAASAGPATLVVLIAAQVVGMVGVPMYNINQVSLRQAITPPDLRGRVNATMRCLVWGTMPIGSLLGGFMAEAIGLRPTIAVAGAGMLLASVMVACSPVLRLGPGTQPAPLEE
jgi:MFS family permease